MKKIVMLSLALCLVLTCLTGCLGDAVILDKAKDNVEESVDEVNALEIELFNNQFLVYAGNSVKGVNVKSLIVKVLESNNKNEDRKVNLVYIAEDGNKTPNFKDTKIIDNQDKYKVEVSKENKQGLISEMTITKLAE